MLVGIQPQPHMASEDLVLLLPELRVELPGRAPCGEMCIRDSILGLENGFQPVTTVFMISLIL